MSGSRRPEAKKGAMTARPSTIPSTSLSITVNNFQKLFQDPFAARGLKIERLTDSKTVEGEHFKLYTDIKNNEKSLEKVRLYFSCLGLECRACKEEQSFFSISNKYFFEV